MTNEERLDAILSCKERMKYYKGLADGSTGNDHIFAKSLYEAFHSLYLILTDQPEVVLQESKPKNERWQYFLE